MNKKEFSKVLAEKTGNTIKDTEKFITVFFDVLKDELYDNGEVRFADGIGFKIVDVPAKKARNPKTGEAVDVPAKKKVKVKLYKGFDVV